MLVIFIYELRDVKVPQLKSNDCSSGLVAEDSVNKSGLWPSGVTETASNVIALVLKICKG